MLFPGKQNVDFTERIYDDGKIVMMLTVFDDTIENGTLSTSYLTQIDQHGLEIPGADKGSLERSFSN